MIKIKGDFFPKIVSVGSCSIDELLDLPHLPTDDETILAKGTGFMYGGKGSNQAMAVARLGARSYFLGCVGMDPHGQQILRHLKDDEVNIGFVKEDPDLPTGTAFVLSSESGSAVLISPGANHHVTPKLVQDFDKVFLETDFILCQPEIPNDTVSYVCDLAEKRNIPFGFYASPADGSGLNILPKCRFFLVKEKDLEKIFGHKDAEALLRAYPEKLIIISQGHRKSYAEISGEIIHISDQDMPPFPLGMGDAFAAAVAFSLAHGNTFSDAVIFSHEACKFAGRFLGSQQGLPYRKELKSLYTLV